LLQVLLINYEFPPVGAGAGNATAHIARYLAESGVDVRVLTSSYANLSKRERRDGYTVLRAPAIRRRIDQCTPPEMLSFIGGAAVLASVLCARWRPDAACAFFGIPSGPVALLLRKLFAIPYLVSLRGGDVPGFMGEELARLHTIARPVTLPVWKFSSGLIANSPGLLALARQSWSAAPIQLIPNGVDVETFCPPDRARPSSPLRLLTVGRLARQKGVIHLLQALAASRAPMCLRVVGDGPERARLQRAAEDLGVAGRVEFTGWVQRPGLPEHYRWADAFVLPSLDEGMPNAVLEALASGLPVIGTDVSGTRDLIDEGVNGYLVPAADTNTIASILDHLGGRPALVRALGERARASALGRRWEGVAEQYRRALVGAGGNGFDRATDGADGGYLCSYRN
jgi:glycosyltransferase involved in cell wall biosynthesis